MTDAYFGVNYRDIDSEPRPVLGADLSTIGMVGPADGADENIFPINLPVVVRTNEDDKLKAIGTQGYLRDSLEGIAEQLGEMQTAARVIIVRTPGSQANDPTTRLNQTIAGVMGSMADKSGIHALLRSPSMLGFTPRLILAPGYTGQTAISGAVGRILQLNWGQGYVPGQRYALDVAGGDPTTPMQCHAMGMDDGSLSDAIIDDPGDGYDTAPTVTAPNPEDSSGHKAVYKAFIALEANPVVATLPHVLDQLLGHAIVESAGVSEQNDFDWRETIQHRRIIAVSGGVKVMDPRTARVVVRPLAPRVAGIAVRRDHEKGAPFHSWANQPVQGIIGPARDISFSIVDGENEGQELLRANIGILARGEVGDDYAIAAGGFVFVGTDNCGEDELWRHYNQYRGRDYIKLGMLRALRYYLGRFNITGQTIEAIVNTMQFFLRDIKADQHILGYKVNFTGEKNSAEKIRAGKLTVGFQAEEAPPLKHVTVESARYRYAIEETVSQLERQLAISQ